MALAGAYVNAVLLHDVSGFVKLLNTGVGLTVIIKLCETPGQLLATGLTLIAAVTGAVVVLFAANEAILPVPLPARLTDVLLFVQLYIVPLTNEPLKVIAVEFEPLHKY